MSSKLLFLVIEKTTKPSQKCWAWFFLSEAKVLTRLRVKLSHIFDNITTNQCVDVAQTM